jgi:prepilin-type N-terminal cleavage/methylation domain-containing protein
MRVRRHAFTLIELLVVITLMGALSAALVVGLDALGPSSAAAQRTLFALGQGVRAQAALQKQKIAILAVGHESTDGFLQTLAYAVETGPGQWKLTGREDSLPKGIYFVPAHDHPLVTSRAVTLLGDKKDWEKLHTKGLEKDKQVTVFQADGRRARTTYYKILEGKPDGKLKVDGKIAFAPARLTGPNKIVFANPTAVLGFESSEYGAPQFLEGPDDFR